MDPSSPSLDGKEKPDSAALLEKFVRVALRDVKHQNYDTLVQQVGGVSLKGFSFSPDPNALTNWFNALGKCVSSLKRSVHQRLVGCFWDVDLQMLSKEGVLAYCGLLTNLCNCKAAYMAPVMSKLVQQLCLVPQCTPEEEAVVAEHINTIQQTVHHTLVTIVFSAPTSLSTLQRCIQHQFPHHRVEVIKLQVYVKNLLQISESIPALRDKAVQLVCEKFMRIDVEINSVEASMKLVDDNTEASAMDEKAKARSIIVQNASKLDTLMCLMFEYFQLIKENEAKQATTRKAALGRRSSSKKLSRKPSLKRRKSNLGAPHHLNSAERVPDSISNRTFITLLRVFDKTIFTTYQSRFTQFFLYYYCSIKHSYADAFIKSLLEKAFDAQLAMNFRISASRYLASFLARAAYLRQATVMWTWDMLTGWAESYVKFDLQSYVTSSQNASSSSSSSTTASQGRSAPTPPLVSPIEATQHVLFYHVCQTIFYMSCHRATMFKSLITNDELATLQNPKFAANVIEQRVGQSSDEVGEPGELLYYVSDRFSKHRLVSQMETLLGGRLNPLRYVNTDIEEEFIGSLSTMRVLTAKIKGLVERNRQFVPHDARWKQGHQGPELDASLTTLHSLVRSYAFPFDPYRLKNSSEYVSNQKMYFSYYSELSDVPDSPASGSMSQSQERSDVKESPAVGSQGKRLVSPPFSPMPSPVFPVYQRQSSNSSMDDDSGSGDEENLKTSLAILESPMIQPVRKSPFVTSSNPFTPIDGMPELSLNREDSNISVVSESTTASPPAVHKSRKRKANHL